MTRRLRPLTARVRAILSAIRLTGEELRRGLRTLVASRRSVLVGYTKPHPIYIDLFEGAPPPGYVFHRPLKSPLLRPLDRMLWRRVRLLHRDSHTSLPFPLAVPVVVECEGTPSPALFGDPAVRHVFVESRWAGGETLNAGRTTLLRPSPPPRPRRSVRRRDPRELVLLAAGYGGMVKGFDAVVRLFDTLRQEFPLRLVLAGTFGHNHQWYPEISDEAYRLAKFDELMHRLRTDPAVTFRPFRREQLLRDVYPGADVYVHLSRLETFGYSILEAMQAGLPVIATRINAIPEIVRHGETGFLIDVSGFDLNAAAWRDHVCVQACDYARRLLADRELRLRMGEAGARRVRHAFDYRVKQRELSRVYRRVLSDESVSAPSLWQGPALHRSTTSWA